MVAEILSRFRGKEMYHNVIESLAEALKAKDNYTSSHSKRVAFMTYEISKGLGIKGLELENLYIAAHLHDIGKIGVPDVILNKNGKLLPQERKYINMHPKIGFDILRKSNKLKYISEIVLHHHERWDGKGYPKGLSGTSIPMGSRIIAVCDSMDAMTSDRPYRKAMSFEECMEEIVINSGLMFDPDIVQYIVDNVSTIKKMYQCDRYARTLS